MRVNQEKNLTQHIHTNILIAGAGCAGLSLAMRLIRSGHFSDKTITLVDRDRKQSNDRTWCFWETGEGFFEDIVFHRWQQLDFYTTGFHRGFDIGPYQYKMIRGRDFYTYCLDEIARQPNVKLVHADIQRILPAGKSVAVIIDGKEQVLSAEMVFNTALRDSPAKDDLMLLQHFKGWVIETATDVFDPTRGTLMDFRIPQSRGTSFVYVLPFTARKALVEFTLFTADLLRDEEYEAGLHDYLQQYVKPGSYTVLEKEFGVIPMTTQRFQFMRDGYYQAGTAGGQTKASSGYTFQFIQKHTSSIVNSLLRGDFPNGVAKDPSRFRFYDDTLLHILYYRKLEGADIFRDMFRRNDPRQIFKFLDNETSLPEDLRIISTLPTWPFLKAAIRQF